MNQVRRPSAIALAIIALCAWQSSFHLIGAWRDDPQNHLGWLAFLIWLSVAIYLLIRPTTGNETASFVLLGMGLTLCVLGMLGSVNVLRYLGLGCAIAGMNPWSWKLLPWLMVSVVWMPAFSVLASKIVAQNVIMPARLGIALLVTGGTLLAIRSTKKVS